MLGDDRPLQANFTFENNDNRATAAAYPHCSKESVRYPSNLGLSRRGTSTWMYSHGISWHRELGESAL